MFLNLQETSVDNFAYIPTQALSSAASARGMMRPGGLSQTLVFSVEDPERLDEAAAQLQTWFDRELGTGAGNPFGTERGKRKELPTETPGLPALFSFSPWRPLLIASVNVSNILLSRALKKRKAVGILKALGSSKNGIFRLFIKEAAVIGGAGTAAGTLIALGLSPVMTNSMGFSGISIPGLIAGILFSVVITFVSYHFPGHAGFRNSPGGSHKNRIGASYEKDIYKHRK